MGALTGLSSNSTAVANIATEAANGNGMIGSLNFLNSSGTVASDTFQYDGMLRAVGSTATWQQGTNSGNTIFSTSRTYDPLGNVTSASTTFAPVPNQGNSGGTTTENYCYDSLNRLIWAATYV